MALLAVTACEEQGPAPDWVGDNPWLGGGPVLFDKASGGVVDDADGMREVLEADIVALEGDRIYALSPYGGLGVVDVAVPDDLEILGRWRTSAQPFEMYVDDGRVLAMFTDYGANVYDEGSGTWQWRTSSRLVALDARDPAEITVLGEFVLPGWIQDSRRVGDVVYVVTQEEGGCWGCRTTANTTITSIDVSDPAVPTRRDQLVLENAGFGGPRSVISTDERLYVAGPSTAGWENGRSSIEVIDVSDPGGELERGASLVVAGAIQNRWQMDEHAGVLRVVSQPGFWGSGQAPVIETFAIASSTRVEPLGSATLTLPRPEALRSVRFDGLRAYAITFEQIDPLFTIDLSDPDTPRQAGSLEIPGWVEHMEPRGDRLLALGFQPGNPEGSLAVSLFDVAELDRPALLSRVWFGGMWPSLAEDPNRLHKAFTVLEELGLVLVPYAGFADQVGPCPGGWQSGIQLLDWSGDQLVRRGLAPSHGRARRALVHRDRMLGMSDVALESFDITDRDVPRRADELQLAVPVNEVAVEDDRVVRLSHDWWTGEAALEVVAKADAEALEPLGRLPLGPVLGDACGGGWWGADLLVHEGHAYLVLDGTPGTQQETTRVAAFDVRDAAAPRLVTTLELPFVRDFTPYFPADLGTTAERVALWGDTLVLVRHEPIPGEPLVKSRSYFELVDLAAPGAPVHAGTVMRPDALAHGALAVLGGEIVSWHVQPANEDGSRVRYYFEHIDPQSPSAAAAPPVNVPGVVAAWDPASRRLVTVGSEIEQLMLPEDECWLMPRALGWDAARSTCRLAARPLSLLRVTGGRADRLDELHVEGGARMLEARAGDDRLFAHLTRQPPWRGFRPMPMVAADELVVVTGQRSSALAVAARPSLAPAVWGWASILQATGRRLLVSLQAGLGELDAAVATAPVLEVHPLYGIACLDVEVADDTAYCAMGDQGLQVVPLGPAAADARAVLLRWTLTTLLLSLGLLAVLSIVSQQRREPS
jgi:hypothetical protein